MARPRTIDPTEAENKVLAYIDSMVAARGRPPILKEIAMFMGWKAPSTAYGVVRRLQDRGKLTREKNRAIERIRGGSA